MKNRRPLMTKTLVARYDAVREALEVVRKTYRADCIRFRTMRGDPNQIAEEGGRLAGVNDVVDIMERALRARPRA